MRVGVTGHRWNKLDRTEAAGLSRSLEKALSAAGENEPGGKVLVCGMAEGTDLLAAAARPQDWRLEAVLPLPVDRWGAHLEETAGAQDSREFSRLIREAVVVVLPHPTGPDYGALAQYLANECDRIIAVWDGLPGRPGGTAEVIRRAEEHGIPVTVIPVPSSH